MTRPYVAAQRRCEHDEAGSSTAWNLDRGLGCVHCWYDSGVLPSFNAKGERIIKPQSEAKPPCKRPECERKATAPRGLCWPHYNAAMREYHEWHEEMNAKAQSA